jgi:putative DNA primase/helicase
VSAAPSSSMQADYEAAIALPAVQQPAALSAVFEKYSPRHGADTMEMMKQCACQAGQNKRSAARGNGNGSHAEPPGPAPAAEALVFEAAHAEVLKSEWLGRYRWAPHTRTWRRWDGHVWEAVDESVVVAAAQNTLRSHYGALLTEMQGAKEDKRLRELHKLACRYTSVIGGLAFLRGEDGFFTAPEEWDADAYALNCADGLLDVRTHEIRPHDPDALCTRITKWSLGKESDPSSGAWERHLAKWLPDANVRRQVQRDLGRALVDAVLEHSLSIWYGIGRNGKSTTADTLELGLAGYAMQAAKDLLVTSRNEHHPTEIAELAGSRVVFVEETADGKSLDEAQVKRLTGGGNKRAHFMHRDNFDVPQTFSISLLVNHRPHVRGGDPGIWERLRLIPWIVRLPFAEQRPQDEMVTELMEDGPWMLRWMVAGFADWQADHHWIADAVKAATRDYRAEEDALQGFIDRYCIEDPHGSVPKGALYEAWAVDYVTQNPGAPKAPSKIAFGKMLRDRGVIPGTDGHAKVEIWRGLALKAQPEPAQGTLETPE